MILIYKGQELTNFDKIISVKQKKRYPQEIPKGIHFHSRIRQEKLFLVFGKSHKRKGIKEQDKEIRTGGRI